MNSRRYSKDEMARRGDELYERLVAPTVTPQDLGKVVAIDVESGEFNIAEDVVPAADGLLDRKPTAQVWLVRIGYPALHRLGRIATA
jgi:hypothetical protein